VQLEELSNLWTKVFGIHGPQWMIVMAFCRLARGEGVHVQAIADRLQVNPTCVTSQSRYLESKGLIQRKATGESPESTILTSTEMARRHLAELA
jgi:DNA-binding MarR family transcriptional regulator